MMKLQLPTCSECGRRIEDQNQYYRQGFYVQEPQRTKPSERRPQSATTRGTNRRGVVGRHLRPSSAGKDRRFHAERGDGWIISNALHQHSLSIGHRIRSEGTKCLRQEERKRHLPSAPLRSKPEAQNVVVDATEGKEKQSKKERDSASGNNENEMLCHETVCLMSQQLLSNAESAMLEE